MATHGRIALCGLINQYNDRLPPEGPRNIVQLLVQRVKLEGFIIFDHWDEYPAFVQQMACWIKEGKIEWKETVYEGLEQTPAAFLGLFSGANTGKMLVKL